MEENNQIKTFGARSELEVIVEETFDKFVDLEDPKNANFELVAFQGIYMQAQHYFEFDGSRLPPLTKRLLAKAHKDRLKFAFEMIYRCQAQKQDLYYRHIEKKSEL